MLWVWLAGQQCSLKYLSCAQKLYCRDRQKLKSDEKVTKTRAWELSQFRVREGSTAVDWASVSASELAWSKAMIIAPDHSYDPTQLNSTASWVELRRIGRYDHGLSAWFQKRYFKLPRSGWGPSQQTLLYSKSPSFSFKSSYSGQIKQGA